MSDQTTIDSNKNVTIVVSQEEKAATPKYLSEIILILSLWVKTGLVSEINEKVKVTRGRMGQYEVIDFSLLLLAYTISNERNLELLSKNIKVFACAIAVVWNRKKLPSTSALSRFLYDIKASAVTALRKVFFEDLITNGIGIKSLGGLYDRSAKRNIVFDIDATKAVARQRSLPKSLQYPEIRRRRTSYKAGYKGRKRGEVVRSRTTVQQSHTNEWLGSFAGAGNGDIWGELQAACEVIVNYLKAHNISVDLGLARLDGAYGWARGAYICNYLHGLSYLMRCSDYSFLKNYEVIKTIESTNYVSFQHPDSSKIYQLYDVGFIDWDYNKELNTVLSTRLIVVCSQAPKSGKKPSVGKLVGGKVYELFVTNLSVQQLTSSDTFEIYCARGAFEETLRQEDLEENPDRFCSANGFGQEFFQLISQWLWNARLRIGFAANPNSERRTLFCQPISTNQQLTEKQNLKELSQASVTCSIFAPEVSTATIHTKQSSSNTEISDTEISDTEISDTEISDIEISDTEISDTEINDIEINDIEINDIEINDIEINDIEINQDFNSVSQLNLEHLSDKATTSKTQNSELTLSSSLLTTEAFSNFSDMNFQVQEDGNLTCPAGNILSPISQHQLNQTIGTLYQANSRDCLYCYLARFCKPEQSSSVARQVFISNTLPDVLTVDEQNIPQNTPIPIEYSLPKPSHLLNYSLPIYWDDLPATFLRRFLPSLLHLQHLDISAGILSAKLHLKTLIFSRSQRSHRRLSWSQRLLRNQSTDLSTPWLFTFHSLPFEISHYFNLISSKVA